MGLYAASMVPLSHAPAVGDEKKVFYADDGNAAGKLIGLRDFWQDANLRGPVYGYFPHAPKTVLITKPAHLDQAKQLFPDITITTDGHRALGSFIGTPEATDAFVREKVSEWERDIKDLAEIAESEPQLAYTAYVYGMSRRWQFICRTTPKISESMKSLEELIRSSLIPAIIGVPAVSDEMRLLLSQPARMGGMGFLNPSEESDFEYQSSKLITSQLTQAIFNQERVLRIDEEALRNSKAEVREAKNARLADQRERLSNILSESMQRLVLLLSEKGASTWLSSLPLKAYGFRLNKQQFRDAVCMRYDLKLRDVPRNCACGSQYSINHCLSCKRGGFVHMRHNAVRDTFAELLEEVCKDVCIEPQLLPVNGEELPHGTILEDGARSDVSAIGLWQPLSRAFLDIKVCNPFAQTNSAMKLDPMYKRHENVKKYQYNARIIEVEKATFTPVVFSCTGGAAPEATRLMKLIAEKRAAKRKESYAENITFVRRRITFDVLRTCLLSFRGNRKPDEAAPIADLDLDILRLDFY